MGYLSEAFEILSGLFLQYNESNANSSPQCRELISRFVLWFENKMTRSKVNY